LSDETNGRHLKCRENRPRNLDLLKRGDQQHRRQDSSAEPRGAGKLVEQGECEQKSRREGDGVRRRQLLGPFAQQDCCLEAEHAGGELPESGACQVENLEWVRPVLPGRYRKQQSGEVCGGRQSARSRRHPSEKQKRKQKIELLFDTERPCVGKGIELGERRKIISPLGKSYVAETEEGIGSGLVLRPTQPRVWDEKERRQSSEQNTDDERGQNPNKPASVEICNETKKWQPAASSDYVAYNES